MLSMRQLYIWYNSGMMVGMTDRENTQKHTIQRYTNTKKAIPKKKKNKILEDAHSLFFSLSFYPPADGEKLSSRPFLMQSDLSIENGLFRLKHKSGFLEKELFRLNFFRLRIPTGGSSRKTRLFRLDPPVEKLSRKSFTRVF